MRRFSREKILRGWSKSPKPAESGKLAKEPGKTSKGSFSRLRAWSKSPKPQAQPNVTNKHVKSGSDLESDPGPAAGPGSGTDPVMKRSSGTSKKGKQSVKRFNRFDEYEILNMLGSGGFGDVVLVRERATGNHFALKLIKKELLQNLQNNFNNVRIERDILTGKSHRFLGSALRCFQSPCELCVLMDFYSGGSLSYHLKVKKKAMESPTNSAPLTRRSRGTVFPLSHVAFYAAETILALQHIHRLGYIHRDIKPANLMLDEEGHIRLIDFGISKAMNQDVHTCADFECRKAKTILGSAEYIAPEVAGATGRNRYGKSCDYWSLGITLFELLSGFTPFRYNPNEERGFETLMRRIQAEPIRCPSYFPESATNLLNALLSHNRDRRLGCDGKNTLVKHRIFGGIRWKLLSQGKQTPPFIPSASDDMNKYTSDRYKRIICKEEEHFDPNIFDYLPGYDFPETNGTISSASIAATSAASSKRLRPSRQQSKRHQTPVPPDGQVTWSGPASSNSGIYDNFSCAPPILCVSGPAEEGVEQSSRQGSVGRRGRAMSWGGNDFRGRSWSVDLFKLSFCSMDTGEEDQESDNREPARPKANSTTNALTPKNVFWL